MLSKLGSSSIISTQFTASKFGLDVPGPSMPINQIKKYYLHEDTNNLLI